MKKLKRTKYEHGRAWRTVSIPAALVDIYRRMAKANGTTATTYIADVLRNHLKAI